MILTLLWLSTTKTVIMIPLLLILLLKFYKFFYLYFHGKIIQIFSKKYYKNSNPIIIITGITKMLSVLHFFFKTPITITHGCSISKMLLNFISPIGLLTSGALIALPLKCYLKWLTKDSISTNRKKILSKRDKKISCASQFLFSIFPLMDHLFEIYYHSHSKFLTIACPKI